MNQRVAISAFVWFGLASASVSAQIVADFSANKTVGVTPLFVQFTNLSTYPNDPDTQFFWDFGDGEFGVGKEPNHLYMSEGVFSVSLAIHVDNVLVATKTRNAYITTYTLRPEFSGSPRVGAAPLQVDFANATPSTGPIEIAFNWDFGDGTSSTQVSPTHDYSVSGTYDITLTATADGRTVQHTKSQYITVFLPEVDFAGSPRSGTSPLDVQFTGDIQPQGITFDYFWDFGDGTTSTEEQPTHRYELPGSYSVSLEITTSNGGVFKHFKPDYIQVDFVPFLRLARDCANVATHFPTIEARVFIRTDLGRECLLEAGDVQISENGVPQSVEAFFCNPTLNQADFVFVVDQSGSMGDDIQAVRQGAAAFAAHAVDVGVDARFGLIAYEAEPQFILDLTADVSAFEAALDSVEIFGGLEPALDSVLFALDTVTFRPCAQKIIVLITDEPTNGDVHTMDETIEIFNQEAGTVISISHNYVDTIAPEFDVKNLALLTGGLWFDILDADYPVILEEIVDFALAGWIVQYTTSNQLPPGTEREVTISVSDPFRGTDSVTFTYVERPEYVETRNSFKELDLNSDGRLSLNESQLAAFTFAELDTDGDGFLSLEELLAQTVGLVGIATPVWVDFEYIGVETGEEDTPFDTLEEGLAFVAAGGELRVQSGSTTESHTGSYAWNKAVTVRAQGGMVSIGPP